MLEMVHISRAKIAQENNMTTSFGEKGFYLQTHLVIEAIATANKQLLSSSDGG